MGRKPTGAANRFSELLNQEIKVLMTRKSITLVAMAELTGISRSRLSKTIYNSEAPINTNELDELCKALNVSPVALLKQVEYNMTRDNYALAAYRSTEPKGAPETFE